MSCELPSAFLRRDRVARKLHHCCDCGVEVRPGQSYSYASGVWDGRGDSYKQCHRCADLMERCAALGTAGEDGPAFGRLADWLLDFYPDAFAGWVGQILIADVLVVGAVVVADAERAARS